jgi:Fur family ferric uptake transcriptional regulator
MGASVATEPSAGIGVRSTRQRSAVVAALGEIDDFRSSQELHDYLRH